MNNGNFTDNIISVSISKSEIFVVTFWKFYLGVLNVVNNWQVKEYSVEVLHDFFSFMILMLTFTNLISPGTTGAAFKMQDKRPIAQCHICPLPYREVDGVGMEGLLHGVTCIRARSWSWGLRINCTWRHWADWCLSLSLDRESCRVFSQCALYGRMSRWCAVFADKMYTCLLLFALVLVSPFPLFPFSPCWKREYHPAVQPAEVIAQGRMGVKGKWGCISLKARWWLDVDA